MTAYARILFAGPKHSRSNAEKLSAWLAENPQPHAGELVRDFQRRGFLSEADARGLLKGMA